MFNTRACAQYAVRLSKMKGGFTFSQCMIAAVKYYNNGVYSDEYMSLLGKYFAAQRKIKHDSVRQNKQLSLF